LRGANRRGNPVRSIRSEATLFSSAAAPLHCKAAAGVTKAAAKARAADEMNLRMKTPFSDFRK
jgi:hypothetical protein